MFGALFSLLLLAQNSLASPLDDFKAAMEKPIDVLLPPFHLTFDVDSPENRELRDKDYNRFATLREKAAVDHAVLLRFLTSEKDLQLDRRGYRSDRLAIETVAITPRGWLDMATNDALPHRRAVAKWGRIVGNTAEPAAIEAFGVLRSESGEALEQRPSVRLAQFDKQLNEACDALDRLFQEKASIDDLRLIQKFLRDYL